ncbi:dTMP kinase [Aureimonas jatrophae]|uniref:Thymidylate kinase n=1 Tax=Aureimonas jatrophae TaxID=1166073 RepID=A0A1H0GZ53_9HYPH|nr:dTMP kinase [Aureimonas jatrophae]MBB3949883.1 dTMP kinase [Aureimonas jatrophae]SDO12169.1 thymidylate kinase [Aureimonas jatrophae]
MDPEIVTVETTVGRGEGLFVTFEGGEGAGKTTQITRLADWLRGRGYDLVSTREPGGTQGADAIRTLVLSGAAETLGTETEALLFAAARLDHIELVIRPALLRGAIVLCDRFHDSTRVYQGLAAGADAEFLRIVEDAVLEDIRPSLTILLDLPAAMGLARASARRGRDGVVDRFEREALERHEARRQGFLAIARAEPHRFVVIDAQQDADTVASSIMNAVSQRLQASSDMSVPTIA